MVANAASHLERISSPPSISTYPHACFRQIGPHRNLFAGAHVRVAVPRERRLQLLQLLAGEMRPLSTLPFVLFAFFVVGAVRWLDDLSLNIAGERGCASVARQYPAAVNWKEEAK